MTTDAVAAPATAPAAPPTIDARRELYETLTPRQRDVARLLAYGLTCREISERLGMCQRTADHYRGIVLGKLKLRNAAELARDAIRVGFVPPPDEQNP